MITMPEAAIISVEHNLNLDGVVDSADEAAASGDVDMGRGVLSAALNMRGLAGGVSVGAAQLISIRARSYSNVIGRWVQRDPVAEYSLPNLYEYVEGSPVRNLDFTGLQTQMPGGGGGGAGIPGPMFLGDGSEAAGRAICSDLCYNGDAQGNMGYGWTTCNGNKVIICMCWNQMAGGLSTAAGLRTFGAAVQAHEEAHAAGASCSGGVLTYSCGEPCAYDAEIVVWESMWNSGACDPACQADTKPRVCEACSGANSSQTGPGTFCGSNCP